jgi:uncharacterized protein Yka (UPF0111/DUF47 family)
MSDKPRELWMLADVLSKTADAHHEAAAMMQPYGRDIAARLHKLGNEMHETAEQILDGRYGDPGTRP